MNNRKKKPSPFKRNATKFTVEITVHENWTHDGFNLMRDPHQQTLKDAILEKMLGYARESELKVETIKSEVTDL